MTNKWKGMTIKWKGYIYIFSNPLWDCYKIGNTQNYIGRLSQYATHNPEPCTVELIAGTTEQDKHKSIEKILHTTFKHKLKENTTEYFYLEDEDFGTICNILYKHGFTLLILHDENIDYLLEYINESINRIEIDCREYDIYGFVTEGSLGEDPHDNLEYNTFLDKLYGQFYIKDSILKWIVDNVWDFYPRLLHP